MYTDFWGLKKPPFDNVPDPTMYVDSHVSVENTIAETLFAIEEGNECLTVIVGDVGLGKTMSLRMILDSLDHEKYKIAFVTNPDMSFVQLLKEIIGQLIGKECEIKGKVELLEVFNKLLFETADDGKKILIFIDEANAISPANLESLRLLTNMQDDDRNLFTIVLAGQLEFAKRLEHPKRANLYQRIGTYNKIEKMESEEVVKKYVETRMRLAGATRKIFTDEAMHWLWEYSEHGVPRLVNKIAKLCLKAGETNNFHEISGDVVQQIGERFDKMTGPAVQKKRIAGARTTEHLKKEPVKVTPEIEPQQKIGKFERPPVLWPSAPPPPPPAPPPPPPAPPPKLETTPEPELVVPPTQSFPSRPEITEEKPFSEEVEEKKTEEMPEEILVEEPAEEFKEKKIEEEYKKWFEEPPVDKAEASILNREPVKISRPLEKEDVLSEKSVFIRQPMKEVTEQKEEKNKVTIAGCTITIEIPENVLDQTRSANIEQKRKIAGVLAAQTLEKNPQLTSSPTIDPVSVWSDILNIIMERIG